MSFNLSVMERGELCRDQCMVSVRTGRPSLNEVDLSLWAKDTCDGLMFLGTSVMEEKECISKIKKGIELCDFVDKIDIVSANHEIPSIDVKTFMTLKRVSSNKSLLDYKAFKEIKGKTKEIKNALTEIIENPSNPSERVTTHLHNQPMEQTDPL